MAQTGPRTHDAVMGARYWLTDAGYAALAAPHPRGCTCQPCLDTADDLREERQITEAREAW